MSELLECVEGGAGTCRNEILFEKLNESIGGLKRQNKKLSEDLENIRYAKCSDNFLLEENKRLQSEVANLKELIGELIDDADIWCGRTNEIYEKEDYRLHTELIEKAKEMIAESVKQPLPEPPESEEE